MSPAAQPLERILLKVSGEALMHGNAYGLNPLQVERVAREIHEIAEHGTQVGVVVGAGNFFRGVSEAANGMDRATADHMGMLATVLNALPLQAALERCGTKSLTMSAITLQGIAEPMDRRRAIAELERGTVVIFAGGTGNPFVTTDTAAALRALETGCDALLMAKNGTDGVYDRDPREHDDARLLREVDARDALARGLRVMDHAALAMCADNALPIHVFDVMEAGAIGRVVRGEHVGTLVKA